MSTWENGNWSSLANNVEISHVLAEDLRKRLWLYDHLGASEETITHYNNYGTSLPSEEDEYDDSIDYWKVVERVYQGGPRDDDDYDGSPQPTWFIWMPGQFGDLGSRQVVWYKEPDWSFSITDHIEYTDGNGGKIKVADDKTNWFRVGTPILISGSTENDGYYRVSTSASGGGETLITFVADGTYNIQTASPTANGTAALANADSGSGGDLFVCNKCTDWRKAGATNLSDYDPEDEDQGYGHWTGSVRIHDYFAWLYNFQDNPYRPPAGGLFSANSNAYWQRAVNPYVYHHYDLNSHRKILYSYNSSGDTWYTTSAGNIKTVDYESYEFLPTQVDPKEQAVPDWQVDESTFWKYGNKVPLKQSQLTRVAGLGAQWDVASYQYVSGGNLKVPTVTQQYGPCLEYYDVSGDFVGITARFLPYHSMLNTLNNTDTNGRPFTEFENTKFGGSSSVGEADLQSMAEFIVCLQNGWMVEVKHTAGAYATAGSNAQSQEYINNWFTHHGSDTNPDHDDDTYLDSTPQWDPVHYESQSSWAASDDPYWGCNESSFELLLWIYGIYDWYLDITHPYQPPEMLEAHESCDYAAAEGDPEPDGYATWAAYKAAAYPLSYGTWRRTWKYSLGRKHEFAMVTGWVLGDPEAGYTYGGESDNLFSDYKGGAALDVCYFGTWISETEYKALTPSDLSLTTISSATKPTDYSLLVAGDQTGNIKSGCLISLWDVDIEDGVTTTYVKSSTYSSVTTKTTFLVVDDISAVTVTKIAYSAAIQSRHDLVQYSDSGESWEVEHPIIEQIRAVLRQLEYRCMTFEVSLGSRYCLKMNAIGYNQDSIDIDSSLEMVNSIEWEWLMKSTDDHYDFGWGAQSWPSGCFVGAEKRVIDTNSIDGSTPTDTDPGDYGWSSPLFWFHSWCYFSISSEDIDPYIPRVAVKTVIPIKVYGSFEAAGQPPEGIPEGCFSTVSFDIDGKAFTSELDVNTYGFIECDLYSKDDDSELIFIFAKELPDLKNDLPVWAGNASLWLKRSMAQLWMHSSDVQGFKFDWDTYTDVEIWQRDYTYADMWASFGDNDNAPRPNPPQWHIDPQIELDEKTDSQFLIDEGVDDTTDYFLCYGKQPDWLEAGDIIHVDGGTGDQASWNADWTISSLADGGAGKFKVYVTTTIPDPSAAPAGYPILHSEDGIFYIRGEAANHFDFETNTVEYQYVCYDGEGEETDSRLISSAARSWSTNNRTFEARVGTFKNMEVLEVDFTLADINYDLQTRDGATTPNVSDTTNEDLVTSEWDGY